MTGIAPTTNTPVQVNNFQTFKKGVKQTVNAMIMTLAAIIFAVAHSIVGPLGAIACLFGAAYHGVALNYHWNHTRKKDANGGFIKGTALINLPNENPYANKNPGYTKNDLSRLKHEQKRLNHENQAIELLKWSRGLAKCIIPVVGPIWALLSEINMGGSIPLGCQGCGDHFEHETPEQRLQSHIAKL